MVNIYDSRMRYLFCIIMKVETASTEYSVDQIYLVTEKYYFVAEYILLPTEYQKVIFGNQLNIKLFDKHV